MLDVDHALLLALFAMGGSAAWHTEVGYTLSAWAFTTLLALFLQWVALPLGIPKEGDFPHEHFRRMCLGQRCLSKRCLGQSQLNLNLNLNLAGSGVLTSNLSMSPPFLRQKNITPEISNTQFSFFDVGCFLFSKKGRERALACVAHQINKFYVRTACFFGGVIFCGTLLR